MGTYARALRPAPATPGGPFTFSLLSIIIYAYTAFFLSGKKHTNELVPSASIFSSIVTALMFRNIPRTFSVPPPLPFFRIAHESSLIFGRSLNTSNNSTAKILNRSH